MKRCDARAEAVRKRILRGDAVHMGFADGVRVWWFEEPYWPVADGVMREVISGANGGPLLIEAGDSLFGWEENSQTWRSVFA